MGPGKLKSQSYALFFIFPGLFLFPRLLHFLTEVSQTQTTCAQEINSLEATGWEPTSFFGSFAMATNLCVVV